MRRIKLLISIMFIAAHINSYAQLTVKESGRVCVGNDIKVENIDKYEDTNQLMIFGPYDNGAGGRLAFGDYNGYYTESVNVLIGEYEKTDTDLLWLHGKKGIYLTAGSRGENLIGYYDLNKNDRFNFDCDVFSKGLKLASDKRFKENIKNLPCELNKVIKLRGITYNLKSNNSRIANMQSSGNTPLTEKQRKDKEFFDNLNKNRQNNQPTRYGLVAQEVAEIYPDLVSKDSAGYMYVDYIGFIPILIEAIKEQQVLIASQDSAIAKLNQIINTPKQQRVSSNQNEIDATKCFLGQNNPNPFNQITNIAYTIPTGSSSFIGVYDLNGRQILSYPLKEETGQITIPNSELKAGIYIYALIVDGKEIDSKRMILSE